MSTALQNIGIIVVLAIFAAALTHHRGWWGSNAKGHGRQAMRSDVKRAGAKAKSARARAKAAAHKTPGAVRGAAGKARAKLTTDEETDVSTPSGPGLFGRMVQRVMFAGSTPPATVTDRNAVPGSSTTVPAGRNATVTPLKRPSASAPPTPRPVPRPRPAPPSDAGRTPPMASASPTTGASADLFSAANILTTAALAGDIRSKIMSFKTFNEAFEQMGQMLIDYGRSLSEPGQEYPAMVWEAVQTAGAHMMAAAMSMSEADNGATTVANMAFGELAASSIQTPHNSQANQA